MFKMKHLFAGFALGLLVAIAPSCGGKMCSPATCPTGCCDASGMCQVGNTQNACGQLGATCTNCQLGTACNLGTCMSVGLGGGPGTGGSGGGSTSTGGGGGSTTGGGGGSTTGGGGGTVTGGGGGSTTGGGGGSVTGGGGGSPPTGGGSPPTGGGGGSTCDGCYYMGSCIIRANSNNNTFCGQGGINCASCSGGQTCANYQCTGTSTGGGGGATGGGGGSTAAIGSPCTSSGQCSSLGGSAYCKLQTNPAPNTAATPYPSGFCTVPCTGSCASGSTCAGGPSSLPYLFNEMDRFCTPSCTSSTCSNGLDCVAVNSLFDSQALGGCFLDLNTAQYTGGGSPAKAGLTCTTDTQCGTPPDPILGQCLTAADGFPSGYCLISSGLEPTGSWCLSAGRPLLEYPLSDGGTNYYCAGNCTTAGQLISNRPGYTCFSNNSNGTGNIAWPACASNNDCGGSIPYCNTATGFCCTTTAYTSCATAF